MDLSIYLNMMIAAVWYLIPIFIFAVTIKSAWFKGIIGEWQVNLLIKFFLDKNDYHLIKNVTLPTEGGSTQIDHIVVSKYGIFVVETKNMKGWIFGNENQKFWTQQIFKHKSKFQNPIHQNYKHVRTLEDCLGAKNDSVFSVIIFIGDSAFKTKMPENVRFARGGIEYIKSKNKAIYSTDEVAELVNKIEYGRLKEGLKTNRQHVKHVKSIINAKPDITRCAKCGSQMVLRKAKKGKNAGSEFWGCSSFPSCRNIVVEKERNILEL